MVVADLMKVSLEPDFFGVNDQFRALSNKFIRNVVEQNKWFTFCTKIDKEQIDVMGIKNKFGESLGNTIREHYPELEYRPAVYKFLLKQYLCYYEAPIVVKEKNLNGVKHSFNKFLVTSNIHVIAEWLGISDEEADIEYGGKLQFYDEDEIPSVPYYKLIVSKEGERKISKPRKDLDLSQPGARLIPVYALYTGVDLLYEKLLEDTYDVTFCKDSTQKRVMNTTFNIDKIKEVYTDDGYVASAVESWYEGDFFNNPNLERGYIRVFEMGSSVYDSPTRSINYARIISFEKAEPDLSYINIDLESVLPTFIHTVKTNPEVNRNIDEFVESLELFDVGVNRKLNNLDITSIQSLILWAEGQMVLLSTVFQRSLALFMIGNPQWFNGYTGGNMENMGSETAEWGDLELDLG